MDIQTDRRTAKGGEVGMMYPITISDEEAETIISFIKSHEREDIPDEVWDICMKLMDLTERV